MKYLLLLYTAPEVAEGLAKDPAAGQAAYQSWMDWLKEAKASGAMLDNNGLAPASDATTVRVRDGKTLLTDGPFAETHEQLAGYSVFECKDLDEALGWAAKIPMARFGSVEVRPLWSGA